ncbi:hypothetical protein MBH78_19125 [Oceanimonas sp. NS1]|nr:hypothetical protein [Oceanimonas sp. NS1]
MVLSVAQSAKELEQLTTLANASSAEFQRMAYGAKSAGVEQDKLASIFKDTTDRIGEFMSRGGGEMQDFFEEIAPLVGVTAEQFKGLSGPEALQLYYNSLEKANVGQQRLTSYMEQVADDATALIPLLQNNGEKFQTMGDEAERLGLVLSDLELDQLKEASAAIDAMQAAMQGATNQLVVGMLPAINEFTDFLSDESTLNGIAAIIDGMKMVADVGAVAALVLGSRFVSSVSASGFAMIAANLEATRYQATLARMAGVSATTAAGITAMSVATRGASAAMALVGGPMGAVVLAGTALTYFATRASEAEREAEELDRRIKQMGGSFEGFTVAQAERGILDYTAKLKEAERELSTAEARLFSLNKRMEEFPGSAKYDEWKEDAIRAAGAVDDAQQKVDALNGNLEKLNQLAQGGAGKDLADDARQASKAYEELNKQVGQQIIMLSAKTDAERLAAQVAAGYVEDLTDDELALLQAQYQARDALEARNKAIEDAARAADRKADAEQRPRMP